MRILIFFAFITLISCNNSQKNIETEPIGIDHYEYFEFSMNDYNYSLGYSIKYQIKNDTLSIIFAGELEGEKDTVLFTKPLEGSLRMRKLQASIEIDSLSTWYRNPCTADGDVKLFKIFKGNKFKKVQVNNYYHHQIGGIVNAINDMVPNDYKVSYDSLGLTESLINCGSYLMTKEYDEIEEEIEVRVSENSIRAEQGLKNRK